jgi:hypothetical protein
MSIEIKVFIVAVAYVCLVALVFSRIAHRAPRKTERAVLLRCRVELWAIRSELETLPATRLVYELHEECDRTERTIDRVEAKVWQ